MECLHGVDGWQRVVVYEPGMMSPLPPVSVPVVHYSSYSAFWGALHRSHHLAPLRHLCASLGVGGGGGVGADEFRLMGCVLKAFLQPSEKVRRKMKDDWPQLLAPSERHVELVSAHIRMGPKHTSNYVVLPQGLSCASLPLSLSFPLSRLLSFFLFFPLSLVLWCTHTHTRLAHTRTRQEE